MSNNTDITTPAAYYDSLVARGLRVPQEQEIRAVGKGRQYVIDRNDSLFPTFLAVAIEDATEFDNAAAKATLRSLRKQGVKLDINLPEPSSKPVTRRVAAKATGRDYNRELVVTITPRGDLILRPQGRRQAEQVALSDVYAWAQRNRCLKIARDKAAARKAKRNVKNNC